MKFPRFLQLAALILLAAGAQPAYSAFWQWSKTAATNATVDPSINWSEGMSPSAVNDSARAMMARAAEYRDDISGLLTTGGTNIAYTVTTNQGLAATPNDGQMLSFTVHATNGAGPTLQADGGVPRSIHSSPGVFVPPGALVAGSPYSAKYSTANGAWMLRGFYASTAAIIEVPLGALLPFTGTSLPSSNYIFPNGQCISTTTYATYWNLMGAPASGVCPGGQFQVVNLAGRVPAGLDAMPGFLSSNRLTNSPTGCGTTMLTVGAACANGTESVTIAVANLPPYTPAGTITSGATASSVVQTTAALIGGATGGTMVGMQSGFASVGTAAVTATFSGTAATGWINTPMSRVQPTVAVTYLLRIL